MNQNTQEVEQRIIATLLHHPEDILKHDIDPSDFENHFFAEVCHVMQKISSAGGTVDLLVVSDALESKTALSDLAAMMCSALGSRKNLSHFVGLFKKNNLNRELKTILEVGIDCVKETNISDGENEYDLVSELVTKLSGLKSGDTKRSFNGKTMMQATVDYIDEMHELKCQGKLPGVPSGMKKMDKELGGFHKSDLVVVGARPGMGKTSWALCCAVNAAKAGYKVGFVSTEMSVVQVGMRVTSLLSGISAYRLRDASLTEQQWPLLTASCKQIQDLPLYIYDQPSCSVGDIAMQARAWELQNGIDIIFVDYLTRLRPEGKADNRTNAVGDIATGLKTLARNMNIPVVVLAQLSREVTKRKNAIPQMSDLRDSGVIEQEADQILMLYRASVYDETASDDAANIIIEKNRHGDVCMLNMRFQKEIMKWGDADDYGYR